MRYKKPSPINPEKGKKYNPRTYTDYDPMYVSPIPEIEESVLKSRELDNKYRKIVISTIDKNVKEGKDIERVIRGVANNPRIKKHFEYLTKNGINLENIFKSWYDHFIENQKRDREAEGMNFRW